MVLTKSLRTKAASVACMLTLATLGIFTAFPAAAKVLATVNGKQITDEDLKIAAEDMRGSLPPQLDDKARDNYVLDYLINSRTGGAKGPRRKGRPDPGICQEARLLQG